MKSIVLNVLFLLVGCTFCQAQFSDDIEVNDEKKFFIGGSFNFDNSENRPSPVFINNIIIFNSTAGESDNSAYTLNPTLGYQLNPNWIFGADFLITKRKSEVGTIPDNRQVQESKSNSVGLYFRYIFNPENKFQVYVSPYFRRENSESNFLFGTSPFDEFSIEDSSNNLGLSLGAQYELASWIRITTNVGGLYFVKGTNETISPNTPIQDIDYTSSGFNFRGSSIFLGLEILF